MYGSQAHRDSSGSPSHEGKSPDGADPQSGQYSSHAAGFGAITGVLATGMLSSSGAFDAYETAAIVLLSSLGFAGAAVLVARWLEAFILDLRKNS